MTIVGLHPEELFDKLLEGQLTVSERERLHQHLASCDVCRFEYAARGDFHAEALALSAAEPPPLLPLRTTPVPAAPTRQRRRRSRLAVWGLAAAALITASGALASVIVGTPPWHVVSLLMSPPTPASRPTSGKAPAPASNGCQGVECAAAAPASTPQTEAAPPLGQAEPGARRSAAGAGERRTVARPSQVSSVARSELAKEPVAAAKEASTPAKLFVEANQARRSGDVRRASSLYHSLQDQFPGSAEAELSRVTLSLLLLDSGDAQGALIGFERYLSGSSRGLEAEALVGRARALGRLGRRDLEAAAWQEVRRKYPRSIYGRQATERLAVLGRP
jgi:TolA-binding protein